MTFNERFYNALPLIVFGGITLTGCILIAIAKIAGVTPFLTMVFPILLMIGYWVLSYFLRRIQLHDEQTGDNLYYMGFLFTLTSLGVSLYQFTADGSMDDVVRNFGIAITSTICGIAFRIMFNQTRRDVQDIERNTRSDIATMARIVRSEMEAARREFADFRRINLQMINEGFDEIIDRTETTSKKMIVVLETMATEALKPIESASARFGNTLTGSIDDFSTKLGNVSLMLDNSASKIQDTAKKLDEIQLPSEVIKYDLVPVIENMGKLMAEMSSKFEGAAQEQSKVVNDLAVKFEGMSRNQGKVVTGFSEKIEEARTDQNKVSKDITSTNTQLIEQMKLTISHLEQILEASRTTVQKSEEVIKVAEDATIRSERTSQAIEQLTQKTNKIEEKIEKSNVEVRSIKDILNRVLTVFGAKPDKKEEVDQALPENSQIVSNPE